MANLNLAQQIKKGGEIMKTLKLKAVIVAVVLVVALIAGNTMAWFTDSAEVAAATFTAGTVKIDAVRSLIGSSGEILYHETVPYDVVQYNQMGLNGSRKIVPADGKSGEAIIKEIITEISILHPTSTGQPGEKDFYTMGKKGTLTIELSKVLPSGNGVRVIECSYGGTGSGNEEIAKVEVSSDKNSWYDVGFIKNTDNKTGNLHESQVIIPDVADNGTQVGDIKYIRITDTTTTSGDGYDIFYLEIAVLDEGNWNPGDTNETSFTVKNTGTKDIKLRVKLDGKWAEGLPADNIAYTVIGTNSSDWGNLVSDPTNAGVFYLYYSKTLNGNYGGKTPGSAKLYLTVALDGEGTGNDYQGEKFTLTPTFQAIQASHEGEWKWDEYDDYN